MIKIPSRFPAQTADNFIYIMSNIYIPRLHLIVDFDGHLIPERLARALRLSLDAEPVLGSRFVPRWVRPYWLRIPPDELDRTRLLQEETCAKDVKENATINFLGQPLHEDQGPQIKALLLRHDNKDRLVIKLNHQVADSAGMRDLGYLLASVYRRLEQNPAFLPAPNLGTRSLSQIYRRFSPLRLLLIMLDHGNEIWANSIPLRSMTYPSGCQKDGTCTFIFKHFPLSRIQAFLSHCSTSDATVNDVFMTAMLRSLVKQVGWDGKAALRVVGTVDLRRYTPNNRIAALCNASGLYYANLSHCLMDNFNDTLSKLKSYMDRLKAGNVGLGFVLGSWLAGLCWPFGVQKKIVPRLFLKLTALGNFPPGMTNLGSIDTQSLDFGTPSIASAVIVPPPCCPPFLGTGLSGFGDTITISAGFFESAISKSKIEELFDLIDSEIPGKHVG